MPKKNKESKAPEEAKPAKQKPLMELARDLRKGVAFDGMVRMRLTKCASRCAHTNPDGQYIEFEEGDVMGQFPAMPKIRVKFMQAPPAA